MKRIVRFISITLIVAGFGFASTAAQNGGTIEVINLDDDIINPVAAEYITTSIEGAERSSAECLIIKLDTPGGLLTSTRTIVKRMMNAKVPIVVYVAPKGARAGSAGVFITLAANIAAMAPSTNIGAAHPVQLTEKQDNGDMLREILKRLGDKNDKKEEPKETPMDQKILNDTKAWVKAIAKERGRNEKWALKAVVESVSTTDSEAKRLGIIDFVAKDIYDLITKLDGKRVKTLDGEVTLRLKNSKIIETPKDFRLRWLTALAHPNIAYILLMLGFYGLLFEFTNPGVGFPGIAGAVCLVLAFFGLQVLPTNYAGVALIVLGIVMLIAEIKITSYGFLTIGGIMTLFLGSLILFSSPYDFMRVSLPIAIAFTAATLAIALFLIFIVMKARKRRPVTGTDGLIGMTGEVEIWDDKQGKVLVHGELWNAICEDKLEIGDQVEVTKVDGMTVHIKRVASS